MSEMTALVFDGPGRMVVEPRQRPKAAPGEVVVAVSAAGICGSELTSFTGDSTRRPPGRVFGHEIAGTVTSVGPGSPAELLGRRIAVNPLMPCGRCPTCASGRTNACPNRSLLGMQVDGGFAEEVAVPASAARELGDLGDIPGTLVEPLANAVHVARLLPGVIGEHILVFGAGAIGLCVVSVLRHAGAGTLTVVDPVPARRELALRAGAQAALEPERTPELGEADHVVDAAGVTSSRRQAISSCAAGGSIVLLGLHTAESELPINAAVAKELTFQCSYAYTARDFEAA
ncbi:MAG TPA: alcohol dehydrogenase catalytic domain-containing protein, partial [Solirubrobacteraceae bacterium]|nr:alcohol dehydrogenase catalytic domain-containing protein [Solirubrobacteraceae bacterium]